MHARANELTGYPCDTMKGCDWAKTDLMIHWAGDQNNYSDCQAMGDILFLDAKERGAKLIVIDPRFGVMASKADVWIPIPPGYDGALMLGMMNIIINENLYDANFVRDWTVGFEDLKEYVQQFPPGKVEQITGISADTIGNLAREYATTPRALIYSSKSGVGQHNNGVDTARLQKILIAITGHIDTPGGNIVAMPSPALWPASSSSSSTGSASSSTSSATAQQAAPRYPLMGTTITTPDFLDMLSKKEIKAACQFGNSGIGVPNNRAFWKMYKEIPFIAACDLFMTPLAEIADVIIPGSSYIESMAVYTAGTYTNYYSLILTEPIPQPLTEMTDEDACFMLMKKLGLAKDYPYESWEDEIGKRLLQGTYKIPLTAKEMIKQFPDGIVVPRAEQTYKKYEKGLLRTDKKPGFNTPSGKFGIRSSTAEKYGYDGVPKWEVPWVLREEERKEFPLICNTCERTWFYGCAGFTHINPLSACSYLSEMDPEPFIRLNEKDAMERGIKDGDMVIVTARCSATETASIKLRAKIPPPHGDIMPGVCSALRGFVEANTADLLPDPLTLIKAYDPISGSPPVRGILVQVKKA